MDILPAELLRHIFILIADENSHSLLAVCRVNRRFYGVASPLLVRSWRQDRHTDLGGFIRFLLRKPEIRTEIRELKFRSILSEDAWLRTWEPWEAPMSNRLPPSTRAPQILLDLDAAEKSVLAETFSRHANSSDSLIRQVRRGISDALCVFLLFWAINLEHLDIALPTNGGSLEIIQCLERVPPTPPDYTFTPQNFQRLGRVSLKGDTSHYADGQQMAPVLRLPVLTTLRLAWMSLEHLAQAESGRGIGNEFPRSTSSLETLVIKNCRVTYAGLTVLTTACQSLRHLDLTWHRGLSKLLQPGTELIGALPSSIETVKFSDNSSGFKTNQWLAFFEDIMDHRSFLADLKIINMWDIPIQKRYYDLCTTHIAARYSPEETSKLLLHDPECDSVHRIHVARDCSCYWTPEQRRRYQNRKRRGQV